MRKRLLRKFRDAPLRTLCYQHFASARLYHKLEFVHENGRTRLPPLLIYQMGKVGSSSLTHSLINMDLQRPVYQIHYLTDPYLSEVERYNRTNFRPAKAKICRNNWHSSFIQKQLHRGLNGRKYQVISMTRDPIARNISSFFENLDVKPGPVEKSYRLKSFYDFETIVHEDDLSSLQDLFLRKFDHDTPLVFFDREIREMLGVDVFSKPFPREQGYDIYDGDHANVLLIRLENLDQCVTEALHRFLGIENFALTRINIGSDKRYSRLYRRFLESIRLPDDYLDEMYESAATRHFYSRAEIDSFRNRWQRP